ncbi:MAG: DsrE family protein [Nitrospirae bacterium]|nr:DsrE family protein [Nitrospirota bacterium]
MKLGILVNTDRHLKHLIGLSSAALSMGHEVNVFFMDSGARLLGCEELKQLCSVKGVRTCFCDFNARALNISKEGLPSEAVCGSQYDNALMVNEADRVIVL